MTNTPISADGSFRNEANTLIRVPLDPSTGAPFASCRYALFPGMALARSEPRIVVLLYDALLHQHPDTAMFLYKGREGSDPLLNRKWSERLLTRWRNLGKPAMIITTPEDMKFFRGILTEIPTVSLYDELLACSISGSCNRELYRIYEPAQFGFEPALRELAEQMGAVLYDGAAGAGSGSASDGGASDGAGAVSASGDSVGGAATDGDGVALEAGISVSPEEAGKIPFLTSSIDVRNSMKKRGFDAVHILELIFGMGLSNEHLAHSHAHDHDGEHVKDGLEHSHEVPMVRDTKMSAAEEAALADLFSSEAQEQNLQELHDTLLSLFWGE